MSSAHIKTGAVGILGLQAGEDVNKRIGNWRRRRLEEAHASATSQGHGELAQWIAK